MARRSDHSKDELIQLVIDATRDLVDEEGHPTRAALERVLGFFAERLQPAGAAGSAPPTP